MASIRHATQLNPAARMTPPAGTMCASPRNGRHGVRYTGAMETPDRRATRLQQVIAWMEGPMVVLGLAWLVLLVIDLVTGLAPAGRLASLAIWVVFIADFLLEFILAPRKGSYLRHNWLMLLALFVPALRVLRALQVIRLVQGARLVSVLSSISRGMAALRATVGRHGFRYVMALTTLVTVAGAAGMYAFEYPALRTYPEALWWTAMIMATIGSGFWPVTPEGRILCLLLALYAFSVFGYVTAALATVLLGRAAGQAPEADALRADIAALRDEVRALAARLPGDRGT
jgi:voltage-gated potassium channel